MIHQRIIRLYPLAEYWEAWKLTYPPIESSRQSVKIEPMRFIPHDGRAKQ